MSQVIWPGYAIAELVSQIDAQGEHLRCLYCHRRNVKHKYTTVMNNGQSPPLLKRM